MSSSKSSSSGKKTGEKKHHKRSGTREKTPAVTAVAEPEPTPTPAPATETSAPTERRNRRQYDATQLKELLETLFTQEREALTALKTAESALSHVRAEIRTNTNRLIKLKGKKKRLGGASKKQMPAYQTDPEAAKYFGLSTTITRPQMMKAVSKKIRENNMQLDGEFSKFYRPSKEFYRLFNLNDARGKDGRPILQKLEVGGKQVDVLAWNDNPRIITVQVENRPRAEVVAPPAVTAT